jgi:hypothetical protein
MTKKTYSKIIAISCNRIIIDRENRGTDGELVYRVGPVVHHPSGYGFFITLLDGPEFGYPFQIIAYIRFISIPIYKNYCNKDLCLFKVMDAIPVIAG